MVIGLPLLLLACGKPACDPRADATCGAFDHGQAAYGANPAALDGLYVPALAGCTLTTLDADPWFDSDPGVDTATWDSKGRLVHELSVAADGTPLNEVTLEWDGPCVASRTERLSGMTIFSEHDCDAQGWPLTDVQWYELDDEPEPLDLTDWRYERTYDDGLLVRTLAFSNVDGTEELQRVEDVRWRDGRVEEESTTQGNTPGETVRWTWTEGLLTEQLRTPEALNEEPRQLSWTYREQRMQAYDFNDERIFTWTWPEEADWPTRRVDSEGFASTLEYDCPEG